MQKELITYPEVKLIGISIRTNNANEMNPNTGKIGPLLGTYFSENLAAQIPERKNPGITFCAYTNYASDEHGDYTYFIGEEVNSLDHVPEGFTALTIPASTYQRFTVGPGNRTAVIIQGWQAIWTSTPEDLGGKRAYKTDFERYDQRAMDPENAIVDIYIGII